MPPVERRHTVELAGCHASSASLVLNDREALLRRIRPVEASTRTRCASSWDKWAIRAGEPLSVCWKATYGPHERVVMARQHCGKHTEAPRQSVHITSCRTVDQRPHCTRDP